MAVNRYSMDKAEVTYCYDIQGSQIRQLPWVFLRFGDAGEERKYVMPRSQAGSLTQQVGTVYRSFAEYMTDKAFPYGAPVHYFNEY